MGVAMRKQHDITREQLHRRTARYAGPTAALRDRVVLDHMIDTRIGSGASSLADGASSAQSLLPLTLKNTARRRRAPHGSLHKTSATSEPDLFWALRGGGGNLGVATSFEFRLHPIGPEVYAGLVVYHFARARQVLSVWAVLRKAPPLPFLPAWTHGTEVVVLPLVFCGSVDAGRRAAAPVLKFGDPIASTLGPTPYAGFQTAFDPLLAPGGRNYWKSTSFSTLSGTALELVIGAAARLPVPECEIFIAQLGGAMARVDASATAFVGRDAHFIMNVHGRWSDAGDDQRVRAWARQAFEEVAPHATGSGYVNFLTEDEGERVSASYGANYPGCRW